MKSFMGIIALIVISACGHHQQQHACLIVPDRSMLIGTDWTDADMDQWIAERTAVRQACLAQ